MKGKLVALGILLAALAGALFLPARVNLPDHLLHHRATLVSDMFSKEEVKTLLNLAREMKVFPTNTNDTLFYTAKREHIGEAMTPNENGECAHQYMQLSKDKKECVLPGRVDIGHHFIRTGGYEGKKEFFEDSVARLLSFGRYIFSPKDYPFIEKLFTSAKFQAGARSVCPPHQQYLDPFQFNFIVQVPGQTVALHVDGVYFWGATRFEFPQWLLAVMKFSGLFEERFIHQVQVVGYFHEWNDTATRAGDFVYYTDNVDPLHVPPYSGAASVVDGSKVVHAGTMYYPNKKAPKLEKGQPYTLEVRGEDEWAVMSKGQQIAIYKTDDLRWTIVYRARCFTDKEEMDRYHAQKDEDMMSVEDVLSPLRQDLVTRGKLTQAQADALANNSSDAMPMIDFALLLLDEYIKYPLPPASKATIPYNYCALAKIYPWTKAVLKYIC